MNIFDLSVVFVVVSNLFFEFHHGHCSMNPSPSSPSIVQQQHQPSPPPSIVSIPVIYQQKLSYSPSYPFIPYSSSSNIRTNRGAYYGRIRSARGSPVYSSSPSTAQSQSIFIPRALWVDPLDYPVQSLQPPSVSHAYSRVVPPQTTIPLPLALLIQNTTNSLGIGQAEQALFEKALFELLANSQLNVTQPNSFPLSTEKYFWTLSDPQKLEPLYTFHPFPSVSPSPIETANLDVTSSPINVQEVKKDSTNNLFYSSEQSPSQPTEHLKVVSLCDKTLALLEYGNPKNPNQPLKCELFDLEKNPESAYTEAKKTGIPIQSVSFREMREIINACRVLAEGEFNPNTVSVGAPPPPQPPVVVETLVSNPNSNNLHQLTNNNSSNSNVTNIGSGSSTSAATAMLVNVSPSSATVSSAPPSPSAGLGATMSSALPAAAASNLISSSALSAASPSAIPIAVSSPELLTSSSPSPIVLAVSSSIQSSPSSSSSSGTSSSSASSISTSSSSSSSSSSTSDKGSSSWMWSSWKALLPGTKWCGLGDSAKNYFDLGKRKDVDVCCRAHDHCPIRLKALRMGYGLINLSLYTKSHCDCDEDFKRCLKQAASKSAEMLANFYFNIMKIQCIREDFPFVCKEYRKNKTTGVDECVRYEEDPAKEDKMVFVQPEAVTFN